VGVDNCVGAYAAKGAVNYTLSKNNLANTAHNLTEHTAPSWASATGWHMTNNSTFYLLTDIIPSNSNWSMIVKYSGVTNIPGINQVLCGIADDVTGTYFDLWPDAQSPGRCIENGCYNYTDSTTITGGTNTMAVCGTNGYYSGTKVSLTYYGGSWIPPSIPIGIGGDNGFQYEGVSYTAIGYITSVAIYKVVLSDTQVSAIAIAMP
jgi:hypothetical protein